MLKSDLVCRSRATVSVILAVAATIAVASSARAQDAGVVQTQSKPAASPKAPAQKGAPAAAPSAGASDSSLRQRVEQLEEQIVDMQVVIGTLESLAKAPPPSASAAPSRVTGAGPDPRVDRLESQLQALTAQMQQMSNRHLCSRGCKSKSSFRSPRRRKR